jgi:signal transduction histidine kinase
MATTHRRGWGRPVVLAITLANVVKHANASQVTVRVDQRDGALTVDVGDDGVGGASLRGSGLLGLKDRVEALGGVLRIDSHPGGGTRLHAVVSLSSPY